MRLFSQFSSHESDQAVDSQMHANLLSFGLIYFSQKCVGHERGSPWLATLFLDFYHQGVDFLPLKSERDPRQNANLQCGPYDYHMSWGPDT